jgi:murein DD-endopeptidase MepM/ murein hydrolase activator NlpD
MTASWPFHPVIADWPRTATVLDLSVAIPDEAIGFAIGRYAERRVGVYTTPQFVSAGEVRDVHVGVDLFAPAGTPVHAFADGTIFCFGAIDLPRDYGHVVITRHLVGRAELFALWCHLSRASLAGKAVGSLVRAGDVVGYLGDRAENGGWPPHLHIQLSYERPETHDLPGVVSQRDLPEALLKFPDPRLVLGPIY